jgi:hypothetical protein
MVTATRPVYAVTTRRWRCGWELHVEGVGVTQSDTLDGAEYMARDLIALREGIAADSFRVVITPELAGERLDGRVMRSLAEIERGSGRRLSAARLVEFLLGGRGHGGGGVKVGR